jgi:four helix bundle protein
MSDIADELRQRTLLYGLGVITFCRHLPNDWVEREIGKQLLRAGMGVPGNYWSACRGRSDREFIAKLGVTVDEADEGCCGLRQSSGAESRKTLRPRTYCERRQGLRAILSKSHKTARENRQRRAREKKTRQQIAKSPTRQFTKSI